MKNDKFHIMFFLFEKDYNPVNFSHLDNVK